jgi:hypothetical protein
VDVITVEPGEAVIKFQNLLATVLQPFLRILRDANAIFFTVGSVWWCLLPRAFLFSSLNEL